VPAFLMVSTIRYRSFKTFDLGTRRSYRNLILIATVMAAIATHPQVTLAVMAYLYLLSGLIGAAWGRLHRRGDVVTAALPAAAPRADDIQAQEPPKGAAHSG
jgi:phosphatidylserine synthase